MKIGIISDIHSNLYGLRAVLNQLKDADCILCAGDITGYYTFVNEVFEELEKHKVKFIIGNLDYYLLQAVPLARSQIIKDSIKYTKNKISEENLLKIKSTKSHDDLIIGGLKIKMYHGSPWNELEEYIYPDYDNFEKFKDIDADIIILGHTHRPIIKQVGKVTVLNPGSCGQPRDNNPKASFAIIQTQNKKISLERVEYDINKVCEEAIKEGFDRRLIEVLKK